VGLEFWTNVRCMAVVALLHRTLIPLIVTYFAIRGMHGYSRIACSLSNCTEVQRRIRSSTTTASENHPAVVKVGSEAAKADAVVRSLRNDMAARLAGSAKNDHRLRAILVGVAAGALLVRHLRGSR